MNNSPIHPNYETSDYRFDPQMGFSEFLEEARQHASSEEKKGKKSWKSKVVSWLKQNKKSKSNKAVKEGSGCCASGAHISNTRRVHVSGPIYGSGRKVETKWQRPVSGPISLTSLFNFNPTERVPYMCLDSYLNSPESHGQQGVEAYGPVYLVT